MRSSEDCFVDDLVLPASEAGIPLIAMNLPRTFVDVSRDKIEIDDSMYFNHPAPQAGIGSQPLPGRVGRYPPGGCPNQKYLCRADFL